MAWCLNTSVSQSTRFSILVQVQKMASTVTYLFTGTSKQIFITEVPTHSDYIETTKILVLITVCFPGTSLKICSLKDINSHQ